MRVLDWPAGSPDLFPIENVCHIMELKSCIHQEWAKIPLAKLQPLIYSVPKQLQSGKHSSVPSFFNVFQESISNFFNI